MTPTGTPMLFQRTLCGVVWRLPILLLTGWALGLNLFFPYRGLDSDVATFGLMGNDLLRHGYWPTLTYGQNYLFSVTPHLYALLRWLCPTLSAVMALTLAGSLQSLGGLWLVYEALLITEARTGRRRIWPLMAFTVFIGSSWSYLFDIAVFSSVEISFLLLGLVILASAQIEHAQDVRAAPRLAWWGLLGLATGFAPCSRPQMLLFAVPAAVLLVVRERRRLPVLFAYCAGVLFGYLPMLLHILLRAPTWPFLHHLPMQVVTGHKFIAAAGVFFGQILPRIFALDVVHWPHAVLVFGWIVLSTAGYLLVLRRRADALAVLDHVWALGVLALVLLMLLAPQLSLNQENRRYCLHIFLAIGWLGARFWAGPGWPRTVASVLLAALSLAALPAWREQIVYAYADDHAKRAAEREFVPYLQKQQTPLLAPYWDAYLLAFLADGQLLIEAFPWDMVRTYGLLDEKDMAARTVWLVTGGHGKDTWLQLTQEFGPAQLQQMHRQDCPLRLLGRDCELWQFTDGRTSVALMKKYHPNYFSQPYPPGRSAPVRP